MDNTANALEAISKETVNLENVPVEGVFGYSKLEEKKESKILKFWGFMWNPLSWVMEAASIMALAHGGENNAGNAAAALMARLGLLLVSAFIIAQLIATVISATATWDFAGISKIGWRWTSVIWLYNIVTYMSFDPIKFAVRLQ